MNEPYMTLICKCHSSRHPSDAWVILMKNLIVRHSPCKLTILQEMIYTTGQGWQTFATFGLKWTHLTVLYIFIYFVRCLAFWFMIKVVRVSRFRIYDQPFHCQSQRKLKCIASRCLWVINQLSNDRWWSKPIYFSVALIKRDICIYPDNIIRCKSEDLSWLGVIKTRVSVYPLLNHG